MDKLDKLFEMQKILNDKTFASNLLTNSETGAQLKMDDFFQACANGNLKKHGIVDEWIQNYARAMEQETAELIDSVPWKWWSKDKDVDLQNLRVEIVDALHFWLSLAMVSGMDADEVFRIYALKNKVNHQRQDSGEYFHMNKDESDNEEIS